MKRFDFTLQRILHLREFREKEAEIALGRAVAAREKIQLELDEVGRCRVKAVFERKGALPFQELLAIERYINRLDNTKEKLLEKLVAAEMVVAQTREKYIVASREEKVITKLREKKHEVWRKDTLNEESDILDDITNFRGRTK